MAAAPARDESWRSWQLALAAARGPQPLGAFERLFAESYLPLVDALARGLDEPRARAAADEFRRTFSRAYTEAFPTFALTGKRPRMVFDAPDLAGRSARHHGARGAHVVIVRSMRFDVGQRVRALLLERLGPRATLSDDLILYAALPSTTRRQLEGIARGVDAYRGVPSREGAADDGAVDLRTSAHARSRTTEIPRRIRVGARELHDLELVEARLREPAASPAAALDALEAAATEAADALCRHARTLAGRTLLFVAGDHGFVLDARGAVTHGGAAPEEVLVPAFGVLLGEVH